MTFSLTSPRRSHLLCSVVTCHPSARANSRPSATLLRPLGIIGDFLNLLNRPLDRSRVPLPLLPSFSPHSALLSLAHSVGFHPNAGLSLSTLGAAVRPDKGLGASRAQRPLSTLLFIFRTFRPSPPAAQSHTPFISAQTTAMRNAAVIEIPEKSCVNLASWRKRREARRTDRKSVV